MNTTTCRDCQHEVSNDAPLCLHCGAPYPHKPVWDGYGFEWQTQSTLFGLPLIHISFKYTKRLRPKVARGILAIGQFSAGVVNISQFGIGPICISQFSIAVLALSQFTAACYAICQLGLVIDGIGQKLFRFADLLNL